MTANPRAERFFFNVAILMIALVFIGFGSAAMSLPQSRFPPPPFLILHGLIALAWYVLTASQARLIGHGNYQLHMKMGASSILLAIALVVTGFLTVRGAVVNPEWSIAGFSPLGSTIFPTIDLISFTLFYALGFANRKNGAAHKRLMLLAGILMLPPATARLGMVIGIEPLAGIFTVGMTAALCIYDWRKRGRPHWASALGLLYAVAALPVFFIMGPSDGWAQVASAIYQ